MCDTDHAVKVSCAQTSVFDDDTSIMPRTHAAKRLIPHRHTPQCVHSFSLSPYAPNTTTRTMTIGAKKPFLFHDFSLRRAFCFEE
jgi:hypothetical protein